jgi:hypothetical protein
MYERRYVAQPQEAAIDSPDPNAQTFDLFLSTAVPLLYTVSLPPLMSSQHPISFAYFVFPPAYR